MSAETDYLQRYITLKDLAPGQKSYARSLPGSAPAGSCKLLDATVGVRLGPEGLESTTMHAALEFPDLTMQEAGPVGRYFAYPPTGPDTAWWGSTPFPGTAHTTFAKVTVSLIPFHSIRGAASFAPTPPDDRVHVLATLPGHHDDGVTVSDLRLDSTTQQLVGYGPSMARQDLASVWVISFFITPAAPQ
jgi:hypothetical protein